VRSIARSGQMPAQSHRSTAQGSAPSKTACEVRHGEGHKGFSDLALQEKLSLREVHQVKRGLVDDVVASPCDPSQPATPGRGATPNHLPTVAELVGARQRPHVGPSPHGISPRLDCPWESARPGQGNGTPLPNGVRGTEDYAGQAGRQSPGSQSDGWNDLAGRRGFLAQMQQAARSVGTNRRTFSGPQKQKLARFVGQKVKPE